MRQPTRTLFQPYRRRPNDHLPYSVFIGQLARDDIKDFPPDEAVIFEDVCSHEMQYLEPRGFVAGSLAIKKEGKRVHYLDRNPLPLTIPSWVESDAVDFVKCDVKAILLITDDRVFSDLFEMQAWRRINMLIATSLGVPRAEMRRFIRRVCQAFRIPVYLLTAHDAWGYFIFSVLKRGAVPPHSSCKQLSIDRLQFLGIDTLAFDELVQLGSVKTTASNEMAIMRVKAMLKYECFQSKPWQAELRNFLKMRRQCSLQDAVRAIGVDEVLSFIESQYGTKKGLS